VTPSIARAPNSRRLTAVTQVHSEDRPCGVCGEWSLSTMGLSPISPWQLYFTKLSVLVSHKKIRWSHLALQSERNDPFNSSWTSCSTQPREYNWGLKNLKTLALISVRGWVSSWSNQTTYDCENTCQMIRLPDSQCVLFVVLIIKV
jgi:hypothetical protein